LSCNSNKTIKKTESIKILNNKSNNSAYIFYEDFSKESLIIEEISKLFISINYNVVIIPISQISKYEKNYDKNKNNLILSLGNSIYKLDEILKSEYNTLIIDTPDKKGIIPNNIIPDKTLIITDLETIKYAYSIINNKNFKIYFKTDKYAYWLDKNKSISEMIGFKNKISKLPFKQEKNLIQLNKKNNNITIFFTNKKSFLKKCNLKCNIPDGNFVNSVYIPINNLFDMSNKYKRRAIKIKKIYKLIEKKEYLDVYLFIKENKNNDNSKIFEKIFDFISEPLYKIEPDLKRR